MAKRLKVNPIVLATKNQELLVEAINSAPVIVVAGPAGTGKTFVAVHKLAELYSSDTSYKQIVVARPNVPTGTSLGFFPGDPKEKLESWLGPILSNLRAIYGKGPVEALIRSEMIVLQPIETIRGQSFEDSLILVDEAQNLSKEELIAVVTRLGENSKLVLTGDPDQTDRKDGGYSWLAEFIVTNNLPGRVVTFGLDDIVRSGFVGAFVRALAKNGKRN